MISAETRLVGLLGYPVGHSMSPQMQNAAFREKGLPYYYLPLQVLPENINEALAGLKALGFRGANVTVPHKEAVWPLVDWLSPSAKAIGAVNTVVVEKDVIKGYNTDAEGFILSLRRQGDFSPENKKILLLGAGGAARAVAFGLAKAGVKSIYLVNRNLARANRLAEEIVSWGSSAAVFNYQDALVAGLVAEADLVVQSTSLGMHPKVEGIPEIPLEMLHSGQVVCDLVYNPRETRFLAAAARQGCRLISGLGMLVHQGALSFELWTGVKAPLQIMHGTAEKSLLGRQS